MKNILGEKCENDSDVDKFKHFKYWMKLKYTVQNPWNKQIDNICWAFVHLTHVSVKNLK